MPSSVQIEDSNAFRPRKHIRLLDVKRRTPELIACGIRDLARPLHPRQAPPRHRRQDPHRPNQQRSRSVHLEREPTTTTDLLGRRPSARRTARVKVLDRSCNFHRRRADGLFVLSDGSCVPASRAVRCGHVAGMSDQLDDYITRPGLGRRFDGWWRGATRRALNLQADGTRGQRVCRGW